MDVIAVIADYATGAGIGAAVGLVVGSIVTWSLLAKSVDTRARVLASSASESRRIGRDDDLAQ